MPSHRQDETPETNNPTETMDINQATLKDLASIPFMSEQRAQLIIDYRAANGPFQSMDDLENVTGIGERLTNLVKQHFHVGTTGRGRSRQPER